MLLSVRTQSETDKGCSFIHIPTELSFESKNNASNYNCLNTIRPLSHFSPEEPCIQSLQFLLVRRTVDETSCEGQATKGTVRKTIESYLSFHVDLPHTSLTDPSSSALSKRPWLENSQIIQYWIETVKGGPITGLREEVKEDQSHGQAKNEATRCIEQGRTP